MELRELARRTGRFPQLVDPRSRVNGLLLIGSPGFREVSSKIDAAVAAHPVSGPFTPSLRRVPTGELLSVGSLNGQQPRQFIGTRAPFGSIGGVDPFHERWTSRAFDVDWRRQRPE